MTAVPPTIRCIRAAYPLPPALLPALRAALVLAVVSVFWAAAPPAARAQVADEQSTLRLAQVFEQSLKFEEALRYYTDLYAAHPVNSAYFEGVRRCLTNLKRYDEAIALITERLRLYANDPALYIHRGAAWFRKGDVQKAYADWDSAIGVSPSNAAVYTMVADEAVNTKLYEKAVEYLLLGRERLSNTQLFVFEIARAHAMNLQFDKAMEEYIRHAIEQPSAVWQIQQHIAWFAEIPQAMESALRMTLAAARSHSESTSVRYLLAWIYMERKDYDAAYGVYAEIDKLRNAKGLELFAFAQRAFSDKAWSAAARAFQDLVETYPRANFADEAEFLHARSLEEAAAHADVPAALDPAVSAATPGSEAVAQYRGIVGLYQRIADAKGTTLFGIESRFRIASILYERFGDTDGALAILKENAPLRRSVTGRADAFVLMGDIYAAKGDLPRALEQYQAVLGMNATTPQETDAVAFRIAELRWYRGEFDAVLEQLDPLTEDTGTDIANDALSLSLFIRQFRSPDEAALRLYAQAAFLERQKKYSEAAAHLREILDKHGEAPIVDPAWLQLGVLLRRSGQAKEAAAAYEAFLRKFEESILRDQALFALAETYDHDLADAQKALDAYQRLLTEHPSSPFGARARERILALRKGSS